MKTKQINLKISEKLYTEAEKYAEKYGFRNIQEFAADSMREKVFEESEFDETFTEKEIELIDSLIELSIKTKREVSEEELMKALE